MDLVLRIFQNQGRINLAMVQWMRFLFNHPDYLAGGLIYE